MDVVRVVFWPRGEVLTIFYNIVIFLGWWEVLATFGDVANLI